MHIDSVSWQAAALKDQANKAFAAKQYDEAIELYTKAIGLDPKNHVLYSNRSAARAGKRQWADALADAEDVSYIMLFLACANTSSRSGSLRDGFICRQSSSTHHGVKVMLERVPHCMVEDDGTRPSRRTKKALNLRAIILPRHC